MECHNIRMDDEEAVRRFVAALDEMRLYFARIADEEGVCGMIAAAAVLMEIDTCRPLVPRLQYALDVYNEEITLGDVQAKLHRTQTRLAVARERYHNHAEHQSDSMKGVVL